MDSGVISRRKGSIYTSYQKPVAILLTLIAVLSPVYIDQRSASEEEIEEEPFNVASILPVLLVILILAIACSCYWDQSLTRQFYQESELKKIMCGSCNEQHITVPIIGTTEAPRSCYLSFILPIAESSTPKVRTATVRATSSCPNFIVLHRPSQ